MKKTDVAAKNESRQLIGGAFLSYLQMGLAAVINLLYTPLMVRALGQSEYGLYNTVASTISMLSILSLGFNASYIRYFSKYKKNNDENSIYTLNGLFLFIFTIIGAVAFLCGLFLTNNLDLVFATGLTNKEYDLAKILMFLLTINLSVSFPLSVFSNIVSAHERFIFLKSLNILKTVFSPLLTLPFLLMGYGSVAMVSITVTVHICVDLIFLIYVVFILKQKFYFKNFEKDLLKDITKYTTFIALNIIVDQINWNVDKMLLGRFRGTVAVAVYTVGYTLYQFYGMFSTAVSGVFTPKIHKIFQLYKHNEEMLNESLTNIFIKVGRIQFLILSLIATGVCFFGKPFIKFWVGEGYEEAYYVSLLLIIPASIALIQNLGIEIQRAMNKHQFRSIAYFLMAICNLCISIELCQKYGAIGSAFGTAVSLILGNGIIMNFYYQRHCGLDIILFWKNIGLQLIGLIMPILVGIIICYTVSLDSFVNFIGSIFVFVITYILSMWWFGMNNSEKVFLKGLLIQNR